MFKTNLIARALWVVSLIALLANCAPAYTFHGTRLEPPLPPADFRLTDQNGQAVRLSDYRGQLVLLFFGYSHCPEACPLTLAQFQKIRGDLGKDAARVRFVLITVDPARDTPERLREYLAQFDPSFVGLTGSADALAAVYRAYGVSVEKILGQAVAASDASSADHHHDPPGASGSATAVSHTSSVYLLDRAGKVQLIYTDVPWQEIAADVRQMIH